MSKILSALCRMLAVICILPVLTGAASAEVKIPSKFNDLCNFTYRDFKTIKPQYEALFPRGMKEGEAKARLKALNIKLKHESELEEYRWLAFIFNLDFWKLWFGIGEASEPTSGETMVIGLAECHPDELLTTQWHMYLIISSSGRVTERELEVYLADYDFSARGIALKPGLFENKHNYLHAIRSLRKTDLGVWGSFQSHLIENGFEMGNAWANSYGTYSYNVIIPKQRESFLRRIGKEGLISRLMFDDDEPVTVRVDVDPKTRRVISVN